MHGRDKPARHHTPDDGIFEFESSSAREGLQLQIHVAELAPTAGLFLVLVLDRWNRCLERFLVGNLRFDEIDVDTVFLLEAFCHDQQVQFTLAGDDRLAQLSVHLDEKRGVFLVQSVEPGRDLILVPFRFRLNRHADDGLGEWDGGVEYAERPAAERIVGVSILEFHDCADVSGDELPGILPVLAIHHEDLSQPLRFAVRFVGQVEARVDGAGVDTEIRQLPHMLFGNGFKDKE